MRHVIAALFLLALLAAASTGPDTSPVLILLLLALPLAYVMGQSSR